LCEEDEWIEVKNKDGKIGLVPKANLQVNWFRIKEMNLGYF
jgi:flagellar basal body rod protein FlgF